MSWREAVLPASFNGVPFSVQSHSRSGGQRLAVHEFPFRDRPQIDFMGQKANELQLTALLVGDDYLSRRDQLLFELGKKKIGELIHPWLGTLKVACRDFSQDESWDYAGSCRLHLTFIDGDPVSAGAVVPVTADAVTATTTALMATAKQALALSAAPSSPASLFERVAQLEAFATNLTGQLAQVQGWANGTLLAPLASVLRSAQSIQRDLQRLAALPGVLADAIGALATGIFDLFQDDPDTGYQVAMAWAGIAATDDLSLWQSSHGVAAAAQYLTQRSLDNSTSAAQARDRVLAAMETLQAHANDDLYVALIEVRAALVADVAARSQRLPLLISHTPKATLPALVVAYQLYGDASRAGDVIRRNHIRHPGFVPGGRALEVLAND